MGLVQVQTPDLEAIQYLVALHLLEVVEAAVRRLLKPEQMAARVVAALVGQVMPPEQEHLVKEIMAVPVPAVAVAVAVRDLLDWPLEVQEQILGVLAAQGFVRP